MLLEGELLTTIVGCEYLVKFSKIHTVLVKKKKSKGHTQPHSKETQTYQSKEVSVAILQTGSVCLMVWLVRLYAIKQKKPNPDKKFPPKIDSTAESLAAKGFLRSYKPYTPPENVQRQFEAICQRVIGSSDNNEAIKDKKFELLMACQKEFNHSVPNSLLHTLETTQDVLNFYETPVNTTVPLDMMKNMELPENLHVQFDYHRFHPETDPMFNGVTAFPKSSTLVTGLKYKEKYPGHEARTTWPYNT